MRKIFLIAVAMTALTFSTFSNPTKCLKNKSNYEIYPSINDSLHEFHWKTNEYEIFLYRNGDYRINYFDSTYSVGKWTILSGEIIFQKDIEKSTSTKSFQLNIMTEKDYNKIFEVQIKKKEIDAYPLINKEK